MGLDIRLPLGCLFCIHGVLLIIAGVRHGIPLEIIEAAMPVIQQAIDDVQRSRQML